MPFEEVLRLSLAIQRRFLRSRLYRTSRTISLYAPFENEALTDAIFEAAAKDGKGVYYPKVLSGGRRLEFFRVRALTDLKPGAYQIKEPGSNGEAVDAEGLDLIVVPGIAFSREGARIGYGKGYYDRALKGFGGAGGVVVALAYEFQVLNELPQEEHDRPVSAIFTDKRTIEVPAARTVQRKRRR